MSIRSTDSAGPQRSRADPCPTMRPQIGRRAVCAGLLTGSLAGCSPGESSPAPATVPPPAPSAGPVPAVPPGPDLQVQAMLLPGIIDSAEHGPFIELLHAMDEVYSEGRFIISAFPVARVMDNIGRGLADLGLPAIRVRPGDGSQQAFRFSTQSYGTVNFVLYSRKDNIVTRAHIDQAMARGRFPYRIEAPTYAWGFPFSPFTTFESALRKVSAGRIDAFLWAQEETDLVLKKLQLSNIRRELFAGLEDVFLLPRGPRGDQVDAIVSRTLSALRTQGRLQRLYQSIHRPFDPWQP